MSKGPGQGKTLAEEYVEKIAQGAKFRQAQAKQAGKAQGKGSQGKSWNKFVGKEQEDVFLATEQAVLKETKDQFAGAKKFTSNSRAIAGTRGQTFGTTRAARLDPAKGSGGKTENQVDPFAAGDKSIDVSYAPGSIQEYVDKLIPDNQRYIPIPYTRNPANGAAPGPTANGPAANGTAAGASGSGNGTSGAPGGAN